VTLTLKRGTQGSAVLDRAVVAVRTGARSTIVLGQESSSILAGEPYVAQGATASHARVFTVFEGLAVGIEPRSTSAGELTLTLDAHARSAHGQPREFDPGTMSVPIFHQQDADLLDVQRTVTFAKSDNGPRRIVLGNAGSSADALTLEVEVVDLR
jgi:hypothetical protein